MPAYMRQRHKPASLAVQVMQAERQVLHRRRLVRERASIFGEYMRRQLTSPAMLFLAGGLGFAAGHIVKRQASTPNNSERPRGAHNKLFGRVLKLVALVRILSRAFPSAATDPAAASGLSSQAPGPQVRSVAAS